MTMPGGRWKATLTRISMGGHSTDGQPVESSSTVWNNIPAYISISKNTDAESPTGLTSDTEYTVVLPWLEYEKEPLPNDTLSVNNMSLRVLWVEQDHFRRHFKCHAERIYP
jgi:hypothetical protein